MALADTKEGGGEYASLVQLQMGAAAQDPVPSSEDVEPTTPKPKYGPVEPALCHATTVPPQCNHCATIVPPLCHAPGISCGHANSVFCGS